MVCGIGPAFLNYMYKSLTWGKIAMSNKEFVNVRLWVTSYFHKNVNVSTLSTGQWNYHARFVPFHPGKERNLSLLVLGQVIHTYRYMIVSWTIQIILYFYYFSTKTFLLLVLIQRTYLFYGEIWKVPIFGQVKFFRQMDFEDQVQLLQNISQTQSH